MKNKNNKSESTHVKNVHNPYDSLFKVFMSDVKSARDFFSMHLPPDIIQCIDLSKLLLCPQSFVDNKLQHKHVDVLYQTTFYDKIGYIYLLTEQQTEADKNMPLRMMQYMLRIIEHHQKQFMTDTFPIIYPTIFYVSKAPYRHSTDFYDGFADNKELAKSILTSPFPVAYVVGATEEELRTHPLAGTLSKVYQLAYARDIMNQLMLLRKQFQHIDNHSGSSLILAMLEFILNRVEFGDAEKVITAVSHMVSQKTGEKVMTLSEQLIQQGMQQGMQQGIKARSYEIAKKMLLHGEFSTDAIANITDLTIFEIRAIKADLQH